jgi:hypothetical protein
MQFFTKCPDTEEFVTAIKKFYAFNHNPNPSEDVFNPPPLLDAPGHLVLAK